METKPKTSVGLGLAVQADPFQSGREAAQMAKSTMGDQSIQIVLALGPSNKHFKEFVEGVRLVSGNMPLVGIPTDRVMVSELYSPKACVVIMMSFRRSTFFGGLKRSRIR